MFIKHLRIKNYKGFDVTTMFDLDCHLNVVYGINGSGKSRMVDAISFIKDCLKLNVKEAISIRGGVAEVFNNNELRYSL